MAHWSWYFSIMSAFIPPSLLRRMKNILQDSILLPLPSHHLLHYSTTPSFSHLPWLISWPSKFNTSWGYVGTFKAKAAWKEQGWPRLSKVQLFCWPHRFILLWWWDSLALWRVVGLVILDKLGGTGWGWAPSFVLLALEDVLFAHSNARRGSDSKNTFLNL